jgi:hypothetical protein
MWRNGSRAGLRSRCPKGRESPNLSMCTSARHGAFSWMNLPSHQVSKTVLSGSRVCRGPWLQPLTVRAIWRMNRQGAGPRCYRVSRESGGLRMLRSPLYEEDEPGRARVPLGTRSVAKAMGFECSVFRSGCLNVVGEPSKLARAWLIMRQSGSLESKPAGEQAPFRTRLGVRALGIETSVFRGTWKANSPGREHRLESGWA